MRIAKNLPVAVDGMHQPKMELDMSRGEDRQLLRQGIAKGWNISPEVLEGCSKQLIEMMNVAQARKDTRTFKNLMEILTRLVKQVQDEEHHVDKMQNDDEIARIDVGWEDE